MSDGDVPEFQMSLRSPVTMTEEQRHLISKVIQVFPVPGTPWQEPRHLGKKRIIRGYDVKKNCNRIVIVSTSWTERNEVTHRPYSATSDLARRSGAVHDTECGFGGII